MENIRNMLGDDVVNIIEENKGLMESAENYDKCMKQLNRRIDYLNAFRMKISCLLDKDWVI